ncbi:hypothetical protein EXE43_05665 [Halorubrum sp. SS5]|nr:hypothetical protein EXE43_05665 [Halorubrum sp. SS5]
MPDFNTDTDTETDHDGDDEQDLKQRAKAYLLAAYAYVASAVAQSVEEIAPQLRSVSVPGISSRAAKSILLAGVLITAAVAMPADPFGGGEASVETQDPVEGTTFEPEPDAPSLNGASLNSLPDSFTGGAPEAPDPPDQVRASAGSQTMNVETAVVDGEPAIVLEDDRTHDGRWVAIETAWFQQHLGEVPNAAFIRHEDGSEYAASITVRRDSAAFYVREFSTNTVTFDGEVRLTGSQAGDGTQYEYELANVSGVDDPSINLTGVTNNQTRNTSYTVSTGETAAIDIGGTLEPAGPNGSGEPTITADPREKQSTQFEASNFELRSVGETASMSFDASGIDSIAYLGSTSGSGSHLTGWTDAGSITGSATVDVYVEGQKLKTVDIVDGNAETETYSGPIDLSGVSTAGLTYELTSFSNADYVNLYETTTLAESGEATGISASFDTGETVSLGSGGSATVNISLNTSSVSISGDTPGTVDLYLNRTERSETVDPVVELNGETVSYSGTLADGETVSLSQNSSALVEGTNTANISTNSPTNGPASLVGFEYVHSAETTVDATVSETTWSQETNVSKTWTGDRANATAEIPMNDRVVDVRNVELRVNGTTWESVADSDYTLNGTDLTVELGDVAAGSTTEVRATGSKVRVSDGAITVLDPTTGSDALNTRIQVDSAGPDFALAIDETAFANRVHYADNATWGTTAGETTITADGGQTLTLPNATAGAEATVRTWPLEVAPTTGQVTVPELAGDREEPGIAVRGDGNSEVDYTFPNAVDATPYVLYSQTNEIVRDEGLASSPITLTDDNSDETLVFLVDDGSASGSGSGSTSSVGGGGAGPMVDAGAGVLAQLQGIIPSGQTLLIGVGLIGGLFVIGRRSGVITEQRQEAATSAATSAAGTAGSLVERALDNEIVVGALILGAGAFALGTGVLPTEARLIVGLGTAPVAVYLALQQFGEFDFRVWLGSTIVIALLGMNVLAPTFFETIAREAGILLAIGGVYLGYRLINAFRAEAETPDEQTSVTFEVDDDDGEN